MADEELGRVVLELVTKQDQLDAGLAEVRKKLEDLEPRVKRQKDSWKEFGKQADALGKALLPVSAAIGAIGIGSAKLAVDFESSFAGVRKTVDATDAEFEQMAMAFRNLSKEIPINVNELNRLGEAAGALGIPKEDIVDFSRVMAELGVTTNITSDQAAESIAQIQTQFRSAGKETENFASTLVHLGNNGASTEAQILELASRLGSAANAAGMSQAEMLGFAAAMANVGINAEAGGTALSKTINEINAAVATGGEALEGFANVAGMTADEFAQKFKVDAAGAVQAFINGLGRVQDEGGNLIVTMEELGIKEIRQSDTLRRLALNTDNLSNALKDANKGWTENTALSEEASKRFETTESQLQLLWNRIKDVGITIGNAMLPAINALIDAFDAVIPLVEGAANWFGQMPGGLQAVIIAFGALAAAAGPVLIAVGAFASAIGAALPVIASIGGALMALASGPVVAVGAAITGTLIGAFVILMRQVDLVLAGFQEFGPQVVAVAQGIYEGVKGWLVDKFGGIVDGVKGKIDAVTNFFREMHQKVVGNSYVPDMVDGIGTEFARLDGQMVGPAVAATNEVAQGFKKMGENAGKAVESFVEKLAGVKRETANLTAEQRANIRAGLELGVSVDKIAKAVHVSKEAVELYKDQVKEATKAAEKKAEAMAKWHDSITSVTQSTVQLRSWLVPFAQTVNDAGEAIRNISAGLAENGTLLLGNARETAALRAEAQKWANDNSAVLAPSIKAVSSVLDEATTATKGWGGQIKDSFTDALKDFASFENGGRSIFSNMFGNGGKGGILGGIVGGFFKSGGSGAMSALIQGGFGLATGFMSQGMSMLADIALKGLKKIGGFFKDLFGGPSAKELAGREIVHEFEKNLSAMLTDSQRMEAGNEAWKETTIAVRDAYMAVGLSEQDALRDVERLWASSREGGEASQRVVDEITRKMRGLGTEIRGAFQQFPSEVRVPVRFDVEDLPDPQRMAAGGMGRVYEPTLFLAGEAGPEDFAFSGANKSFRDPSAPSPGAAMDVSGLQRAFREEFDKMRRVLAITLRDAAAGAV